MPVVSPTAAIPEPPPTVIEPRRGAAGWPRVGELWAHRELAWTLAARDLQVRYKQTLLGAGWAVLQPLVTMLVLHVFFGRALGVAERVGDVAYPVFLFAGLLPWQLFTSATNAGANCLVSNAHIVSKVYFPRLLLPLAAGLPPLADFAIACVVLVGLMVWYGTPITPTLLLLPPMVAVLMLTTFAVGVLLASVAAVYRDVRFALPFVLQIWFFMTPVIYPVSLLPAEWGWLVRLNPLAGVIEAIRAAVLGTPIDTAAWATSTGVGLATLAAALLLFGRVERRLVDVV